MRITKFTTLFFMFIGILSVQAQPAKNFEFKLVGIIRDQENRVIPGLKLEFINDAKKITAYTDINGRFTVLLGAGDYVLTTAPIPTSDFTAFIKITDGPLNPDYLDLTVNSANVCSDWQGKSPRLLNYPTPIYPPAARAVRAFGEVSVKVVIDPTGKVSSAEAISGHPLLRAAARKAAEDSLFESVSTGDSRIAILTYVFLDAEVEKPNLKRLSLPCRTVVNSEPIIVIQTENR